MKLFITAAIFAGGLLIAGCITGVEVLGYLLKAILALPADIARLVSSGEMPSLIEFDFSKIMQIVAWFVKAGVALYLLFGMKKFVRWQIDTLKKMNLVIGTN